MIFVFYKLFTFTYLELSILEKCPSIIAAREPNTGNQRSISNHHIHHSPLEEIYSKGKNVFIVKAVKGLVDLQNNKMFFTKPQSEVTA